MINNKQVIVPNSLSIKKNGFSNKINITYIFYIFFCAILSLVSLLFNNIQLAWEQKLRLLTSISILSLLVFFIYHFKLKKEIFSLTLIFSVILFLFQFGQYFLFFFNCKYSYFFFDEGYLMPFNFDYDILTLSVANSIVFFNFFNAGLLFKHRFIKSKFIKKTSSNFIVRNLNKIEDKKVFVFAVFLFIISIIPTIIITYEKLKVSISEGYVQSISTDLNPILSLLKNFFIPSLFLMYFSTKRKVFKNSILIIALIYSIALMIIGGRTEAVALILTFLIIVFYKKNIKLKNIIFIGVVLFILAMMITMIATFRNYSNKTFESFFKCMYESIFEQSIITKLIGEMGWTATTVVYTTYISLTEGFLYGSSYLAALLNIIPSSIDCLGIVSNAGSQAFLSEWLTQKVGFSFGTGFSLFAEAYYNFNILGIIPLFIIAHFINSLLTINNSKFNYSFSNYIKFYIFFAIFTLPRREFVFFVDHFFNNVVFILFLLFIINYIYERIVLQIKRKKT